MPFIDDMQERDLALLQTLDGRDIIYTHRGSMPRVITGMFQSFSELADGESVDVVVSNPVLSVRSVDLPCPECGDLIEVDGTEYKVVVIRPDNEGIIELILEKTK